MADEAKPAPRTFDAILCPQDYPPGLDESARHIWRNQHFGPILGHKRVYSSHCAGGLSFVRADPTNHPTVNQPFDHPRAGAPRYQWSEPDKQGIKYGVLIPEPAPAAIPEPTPPGLKPYA